MGLRLIPIGDAKVVIGAVIRVAVRLAAALNYWLRKKLRKAPLRLRKFSEGSDVQDNRDEGIREEDIPFLTGPAHRGNRDGNPATVPFLGWVKSGEQWWVSLAERLSSILVHDPAPESNAEHPC